ncbi:MAG: WbuC family cupin fold metalloprotein [Tannerella sp.]|jgi:cupin fold WbuC family metalloprotein|nr:WbuC family cupin fold metalloprotein [Tannerella sp.]
MKIIDRQLLDATTARAKVSPRLRMNYDFHESLDDPVNRLLNAMEPDTYVRPHRHCNPDKNEIFLLLRGKIAVFLFDDDGYITDTFVFDPLNGNYGGEIKAGIWHGLLVLESGSVIYEIKEGPFVPLTPENMAPWSPSAEDTEEVQSYLEQLKLKIKN